MFIQTPPSFQEKIAKFSLEETRSLFLKLALPEVQELVRSANEQYTHWHEFQYKALPSSPISHEEAWIAIKFSRMGNRKALPITDKAGNAFFYWIPDSLLKILSEIDKEAGNLLIVDRPDCLPSKEQYIISSLMEEAIASSQLEGASTTRLKAKEMLRSGRKPKDISEQMIFNNWQTIQYIRANRQTKMKPEMLSEIHGLVTQGTLENPSDAGKLRTRDDIIVAYAGKTIHEPPPYKTLPDRVQTLCNFINSDDEKQWIHPVVKAALIHFTIGYDHPFVDGNGRTARALLYWYLLSRGYLLFEYLSVSRYIIKAPAQYIRAYMYAETDDNDLTYFLRYNLIAIRAALKDFHTYLKRKTAEINRYTQLLKKDEGLNHRKKNLLYHALQHPESLYTIEQHKNYHGVSYQTARSDLLQLVKDGFLKQQKFRKELVFVPSPDLPKRLGIKRSALEDLKEKHKELL